MKPLLLIMIFAIFASPVLAQVDAMRVQAFVLAKEAAGQPDKTAADVEAYLAFLTEDVSDVHVVYGVTLDGKEKIRSTHLESTRVKFEFRLGIESITMGTNVAIVEYIESSQYVRRDELVDFTGRTILVMEFNDAGAVHHMRRYLDTANVTRKATPCSESDLC
ncbi:MAG: nuclear transport factor 2 family protein [Bacteroidota bacterium]